MSDRAVGCRKCKVFINISTSTGGVYADALWEFVKTHAHQQGFKWLVEAGYHYFADKGWQEVRE